MNTGELFIEGYKIPKPLSKQEVYELLDKIKQGDEHARVKLVEHNIRLVLSEVTRKFNTVEYDKKDLVSIGNVGLMKAITTFDISKKVEFSTYAIRCIDNEILMFLRKFKKYSNDDSLDRIINYDKNDTDLKVKDTISDDTDIVEEYTDNEMHLAIRQIVKDLPERDREIIMLHFGFYNDRIHTQKEIAEILSISRSYVSKLITKIVKRVGKQLEEEGFIELRSNEMCKNKFKLKKEGDKKMARTLQTIYEYFNSYTKEQVDAVLGKLSEDERSLIILRYGEDLNNPIAGKLNKEQLNRFYGSLIPKMKRLLVNPDIESKTRKKRKIVTESITNDLIGQSEKIIPVERPMKENSMEQIIPEIEQIVKQQDTEIISESSIIESMTKKDCLKILELLRTPSFNHMMDVLSVKESVIISLKLGYIDGKYFSTESIAQFLGIEQQEVIDTTTKVLLLYKENINQFIDNAIQIVTEEPETIFSSCIKSKIK